MIRQAALCAGSLAVLSACGGGGTSPSSNSNGICVTAVQAPSLVYPMNGATGVQDGNFTLVLSRAASPVSLATGGTTVVGLASAPVPNPLPSPAASPSSTDAGYAVPSLQAATTYQVQGPLPLSGCYDPSSPPPQPIGTYGTFTTR